MTTGTEPEDPETINHDREILRLEHHLREMTELAVGMVADGTRALLTGDTALSQSVVSRDAPLDRYDLNIETETIRLVAVMQPEGPDLRTIEAILKIASCVDRVGRLGFDIARYISDAKVPSEEPGRLLAEMDRRARAMVEKAIGALLARDATAAKAIFALDDEVDALYRQLRQRLIDLLRSGGEGTERLVYMLLASRHLERVADNACKVAEKTVYAITGERRVEYLPPRTRSGSPPAVGPPPSR